MLGGDWTIGCLCKGRGMMQLFTYLQYLIRQRWVIGALFLINLLGTIYGYYWYRNQLAITEWYLLPFVPDSPTASLFFTLVLLFLLRNQHTSFIAAFAAITSIKYGIWAVVAILWGAALGSALYIEHFMLIVSHLGMALEAILFYSYYRIKWRDFFLVSLWTLLNDFLDYTLDIHPWTAYELEVRQNQLAIFTVLLSLFCIGFVAYLVKKQRKETLPSL